MNYEDLQATISAYKDQLSKGLLAPDTTKSTINIATGLNQYNLMPTALTIYPVLTPLRNILPRLSGKGKNHEVKSIVGVGDSGLASVFGSEGNSGSQISLNTVDITNTYASLKLAGSATFESQFVDAGFIDAKGTTVVNTLRRLMINEEKAILFGANSTANLQGGFAGGAVGTTPTGGTAGFQTAVTGLTAFTSNPGTIQLTAVTGMGESQPVTLTPSPTYTSGDSLEIVAPPRGAFPILYYVLYFAGDAVAAKNVYYNTGTSGSPVLVQASADSQGRAVITGGTVWIQQGTNTSVAVPSTDTTTSANAYNGLFAQLYGSAGAVAASENSGFGPVITSANAQLTYSMVDTLIENMWNATNSDPDWVLVHATEARAITGSTIGAGTPYFLAPNGDQSGLVGGYRVARLTNGVTGKEILVKSHPYFVQGTLIAGSDSVPDWYTGSDLPAPIALNMLQDYTEVDYPPTYNTSGSGDQWITEILNMGTFELYAPVLFGVINSIVPGGTATQQE